MKYNDLNKIVAGIPKTPGILWEKHYLRTSVLIPLVKINDELHLLFEVRSKDIRQGSEICFPGGKYEAKQDNNYRDTAIRETQEELGISPESIKILGQFNTLFNHMGILIYTYIGKLNINQLNDLNIDKKEVGEVFTIPIQHFIDNPPKEYKVRLEAKPAIIDQDGNHVTLLPVRELGLPERYSTPWGSNNHKVIVYKTPNGMIWGITAKIVCEFIETIIQADSKI
jgi:peroxisomal coenzyme A diphosphatase NUDT7